MLSKTLTFPPPRPAAMGKAKQTKKFAEVKRLRNPKDLKP
jgi:hypothetical protein